MRTPASPRFAVTLQRASEHRPVLTTTNAPEHIGIYANESKSHPGELTIDLVNYHYDLAVDQITPVTQPRLHRHAAGARSSGTDKLSVESDPLR